MRTRERHLFFLKIQLNCHFDATRFPSDRTADGDLLFTFSSNILDFQRILTTNLRRRCGPKEILLRQNDSSVVFLRKTDDARACA